MDYTVKKTTPVADPDVEKPMRFPFDDGTQGHPGYLGAVSSYDPLPGEDWRRGNDLPDGPFTEETVDRIAAALKAIVRGERT